MAAEGGEAETQQKEEAKRHTYPLIRVRRWWIYFLYWIKYLDKWYEWRS